MILHHALGLIQAPQLYSSQGVANHRTLPPRGSAACTLQEGILHKCLEPNSCVTSKTTGKLSPCASPRLSKLGRTAAKDGRTVERGSAARCSINNDLSNRGSLPLDGGSTPWMTGFATGGEGINPLLHKGSNDSFQCREVPELGSSRRLQRRQIFVQATTRSASFDHKEKRLAFSSTGTTGPAAGTFSAVSPRMRERNKSGSVCAAVEAGASDEDQKPSQHKQEIHGRRTRAGRPEHHGPHNNIMLQAFNWESYKGSKDGRTWWQVLKAQAKELSVMGVTDVWLPPVSQAVDKQGYLPSELYNLDASKYGTGVQLKELIDELHNNGMSVIADIVINHRSGGLQDNKGHWNIFKGGNRDKRLDWGPWAVVDDDVYDSGGKGRHDTGESYAAAPDLDHTNKRVQDELTDWMNWLKAEIGFDGWRFDFVKGYASGFTKLYCARTNPTIAVGELWTSMAYYDGQLSWDQNRHRQELCNWIDGTGATCSAFDFTTKGILQRAVENEFWRLKDGGGKAAGLIGWWPERAVTFLDNHDTGSTQRHWPFPDRKVLLGYAYILTHPGTPCIFYDHVYDYKLMHELKKLLDLRKRHRINAMSRVNIQKAEGDIYIGKIDNRVILKMGPRYDMGGLLPGKNSWKMTLTGPDFAIWETTAPLPPLPAPPFPAEDADQSTPSHPTQPIHITSKMSEETRNRILKEVPELVDPTDVASKKKPEEVPKLVDPTDVASEKKPTRSEQDHVHKKTETPPIPGITSVINKSGAARKLGSSDVTTSNRVEPSRGPTVTEGAALSKTSKIRDETTKLYTQLPPETAISSGPKSAMSSVADLLKIPSTSEAAPGTGKAQVDPSSAGAPPPPPVPVVQTGTKAGDAGTVKPRCSLEKSHKDKVVRVEVHGRRVRPGRPVPHGPYNNIMLQGFNWESPKSKETIGKSWWAFLKSKVEDFVALGITDIWLPPPSHSVDNNGYLPSELYNLDASNYGTGAELKELIDELHLHGICAIADIVINHRCGRLQDDIGRWNNFKGGNLDKRLDWGPWAVVDDDLYDCGGSGTHDTGEKYPAAPDLDHTNKQVQDELTDWMNWLKAEIGFDGWRFDFVKGYDPKFTGLYCARTNPTFSVGEHWTNMAYNNGQLEANQNEHRQRLCNWIDGTKGASCVFDFTTKGILQQAVHNELWRLKDPKGKPPGLIGWYPQNAVTFIDNHDTGSTQRHWYFSDNKVEMGYAYIITHPGLPCLFLDHLYDFKIMDKIQTLINIRVRNRINAISKVVIQKAESNIYVAKIDDRVILKLGSRVDMDELLPDSKKWKMVTNGFEYCIWESTEPMPPRVPSAVEVEEASKRAGSDLLFQPFQPTQPIRLTKNMSEETRKRILQEVPELVKPEVETKKKKKSHRLHMHFHHTQAPSFLAA